MVVTYYFVRLGTDSTGDFISVQPYMINTLTLEAIEKLQGKYEYNFSTPEKGTDEQLLDDAVKLS